MISLLPAILIIIQLSLVHSIPAKIDPRELINSTSEVEVPASTTYTSLIMFNPSSKSSPSSLINASDLQTPSNVEIPQPSATYSINRLSSPSITLSTLNESLGGLVVSGPMAVKSGSTSVSPTASSAAARRAIGPMNLESSMGYVTSLGVLGVGILMGYGLILV